MEIRVQTPLAASAYRVLPRPRPRTFRLAAPRATRQIRLFPLMMPAEKSPFRIWRILRIGRDSRAKRRSIFGGRGRLLAKFASRPLSRIADPPEWSAALVAQPPSSAIASWTSRPACGAASRRTARGSGSGACRRECQLRSIAERPRACWLDARQISKFIARGYRSYRT